MRTGVQHIWRVAVPDASRTLGTPWTPDVPLCQSRNAVLPLPYAVRAGRETLCAGSRAADIRRVGHA